MSETRAPQRTDRFSLPRLQRSMIPRNALLERLHANIGNGLAVLQAPAGYGKTALAADFGREVDFETRWVTLDPSSSSQEVFAEQICRALVGDEHSWKPAVAGKSDDLRAYLAAAVQEAQQQTDLPILLVVDNAHVLRDSEASAELMGWYLETQPGGWELVLSGRDASCLVEVDRRTAAGECLMLGSAELAFTEEEIAELARLKSTAVSAAKVMKTTGGWPVAVMATLAGLLPEGGPTADRQRAAWERYLVAEVWSGVPAEIQDALLRASLPPAVDAQLGKELLGQRWRTLRSWLSEHDFLYEPLAGETVRLNPMFREFLMAEYERRDPSGAAAAAAACCEALERRCDVADAIELARFSRNGEALAGLLKRHSSVLLEQGAYALLWRAFENLDPAFRERDQLLNALYAHVLARTTRPNPALEIADAVLADPAAEGLARMHAILARVRALRLLGDRDALAHVFDDVRAVTDCEDATIAAEVAWQEAQLILALDSDFLKSERLLRQAINLAQQAGAGTLELLARSSLGQSLTMRGEAPEGVNELAKAAHGWRALKGTAHLGWVLNNLGMGYQGIGDYAMAVEVLKEAVAEGRKCENARNEAYAVASLGDAELGLGNYQKAKEQFEEAIRITATDVLDESLACLSIAGLSGALLGLGDTQEAAFFCERALLIAENFGNPFELGSCKLQMACVEDAAGNHDEAVALAREAVELFQQINALGPLRLSLYRMARFHFRGNRRGEAVDVLRELEAALDKPWGYAALQPAIREHVMFAQWVAARNHLGHQFRELLERHSFDSPASEPEQTGKFPRVVARSLGGAHVEVGTRQVTDEAWASARAKEFFFIFLANRDGIRKEQAVELLYPGLPASKCNSAFHSNLYRVRRAIYHESIVKDGSSYRLNPEGDFAWDVAEFQAALDSARQVPSGEGREQAFQEAIELYRGPFAEEFYSEWAEGLRDRLHSESLRALTTLAGLYASRRQYDEAAGCLERVLERDRYNENAAFELATFRARAGDASSALSFLESYRKGFEEEIGAQLPPRFTELRSRIAAGVAV